MCLSVSEGLRTASALCVTNIIDIVIFEQNMHIIEAKQCFLFGDNFSQDLCSGGLLGVGSTNIMVLVFCVLRIA